MSWVSWIENTIILAVVAVNALYTQHCNSSVLLIPTLPSSQTNVIHPSEATLRSTNTRARTCYVLVHVSTVATLAVSQMPSIAAAYFHNLVTCVFSTHLISPLSQGTIVVLVPFQHHARQTLLRPYETTQRYACHPMELESWAEPKPGASLSKPCVVRRCSQTSGADCSASSFSL